MSAVAAVTRGSPAVEISTLDALYEEAARVGMGAAQKTHLVGAAEAGMSGVVDSGREIGHAISTRMTQLRHWLCTAPMVFNPSKYLFQRIQCWLASFGSRYAATRIHHAPSGGAVAGGRSRSRAQQPERIRRIGMFMAL